ncbi:MAG TPA: hypothetical protein PLP21_01870 [Pyrinomonadaceae bacterium]|nr:hypothetical protein [Acidobacteriota bacterium]HQZ95031.1 hypothetical protein [Pyrinomonadaceae bacterium]
MKTKLTIIAFLLLLSAGISAQSVDKTVESIRSRYQVIAEKARGCETDGELGQYGDLVMNTLTINSRNHQWRAVGIHQLTYKFFYAGGDSEKHLYPDRLVFVKTERRESNRNYSEEFFYSDAGVLMFYFQKAENDDQVPAERRVYFSGSKAVRVIEDGKLRDRLTANDLKTVRDVTASNASIKDLFIRSIKL